MRKEKIINFIETKKTKNYRKRKHVAQHGFRKMRGWKPRPEDFRRLKIFPRPKFIVSCPAPREALSR